MSVRHGVVATVAVGAIVVAAGVAGAQPAAVAYLADARGIYIRAAAAGAPVATLAAVPRAVALQPGGEPNASDQVLGVGPLPEEPSTAATAGVVTVDAAGALEDGVATAAAEVQTATLLDGLITAEVVRAVAGSSCAASTPEEAAAGSAVAGLTIDGQPVVLDPGINTVITVPGVAEVRILEVLPDARGAGWTVRGLHVLTLDPVTGLATADLIVAEAHSAVSCAEPAAAAEPVGDLALVADEQETEAIAVGEDAPLDLVVANTGEQACALGELVVTIPDGFEPAGATGLLEGHEPTVEGHEVTFDVSDVTLDAAATQDATVKLRATGTAAPGDHVADARASSSCSSARTGLIPFATLAGGLSPTSRVEGPDRVATGVEVSEQGGDHADVAVLARDDVFPDALTASTLAAEVGGPLLLSTPATLSPEVSEELDRLGTTTVYLVGGPAALSPAVEAELVADGMAVHRIAGDDRYDTARLIAQEVVALGGRVDHAIVVRADHFADALAASNLATWGRAPILLSDTERLPEATIQALHDSLAGDRVWIGGGEAAVGAGPEHALREQGYAPIRLAGADRYETAVLLADAGGSEGAGAARAWFASGTDFPDALVAGVGAFRDGGRLLLTAPASLDHSPATRSYVVDNAPALERLVVVGGHAAVSPDVERELTEAHAAGRAAA